MLSETNKTQIQRTTERQNDRTQTSECENDASKAERTSTPNKQAIPTHGKRGSSGGRS